MRSSVQRDPAGCIERVAVSATWGGHASHARASGHRPGVHAGLHGEEVGLNCQPAGPVHAREWDYVRTSVLGWMMSVDTANWLV